MKVKIARSGQTVARRPLVPRMRNVPRGRLS
jgi:hypothetical protein